MDEHDYVYRLKPLIVPGIAFLILYPLIFGSIHIFSKLPTIEGIVLIGIYLITGLGIVTLWFIGKTKHVQIKESQIVIGSILGERILEPQDIRRVAFYFDGNGREVAQIRAKEVFYYLNELYFPFPELMSDLENFIRRYNLRSNLERYAGLSE
ncbi:MAG: hypothetical protein Q8912_05355 [Bacillota bacterium]|nr:hypothetical protein [Bacillota bacterium]MDP4158707.1 hypothetical protein [Bacillota bacterium]